MKEISYDGPVFDREEEGEKKHKKRSIGSDKAPIIRTFRSDVQEIIQKKKTTKAQIIMAEEERREARGERRTLHEKKESHLGKIIFILLLVLAFGLGIGAYVLFGIKADFAFLTPEPSEEKPRPPKQTTILLTGSPREQIIADISIAFGQTTLSGKDVRPIIFSVRDERGEHPATTTSLLKAVALSSIPDALLRSLDETPSYGIHSADILSGFLELHSRSYPNTFAGMLQWEQSLARDLASVVNPWVDRKTVNMLSGAQFTDTRVGVHDARVLKNAAGDEFIAYAFADKRTLLITNSVKSLSLLLEKYKTVAP